MNIKRLERLMKILVTVPEQEFDLQRWMGHNECGTTACAVGWAMQDKRFNQEGFKKDEDGTFPVLVGTDFIEKRGWEAVKKFFEIGRTEANHLFSETTYEPGHTGVMDVIARIRQFIKDNHQGAAQNENL